MKANAVKIFLVLFFLFPLIGLIFYFKLNFQFNTSDIYWALKNSLTQSICVGCISIFLGYWGALGLLTVPTRYKNILKLITVIPVFLPSLFSVLIGLSLINPFPMGTWGVVFILSLVYTGFASSMLSDQIESQVGKLGFVAEIYNLPKSVFQRKVLWSLTARAALYLFVVIFVNVFTCFSIPLLVGGNKGVNFEVLIYETIFVDHNWSLAVGLSIMQICFIYLFTLILRKKDTLVIADFHPSKFVKSKIGLVGIFIYLGIYIGGYLKLSINAFRANYIADIFNADLASAVKESFIFYFLSLMAFFFIFCLILFLKFNFKKTSFLNLFLNPSSVLIGFSLYLIFPHNRLGMDFVKMATVFTIVAFVSFFKSTFENKMDLFEKQMFVARSFGINYFEFLVKIFLPQVKNSLFYCSSLIFIFCVSEFALIKASGAEIKTLGTEMANYLSSYRIEGAFVISLLILVLWLLVTAILGALFGVYKKS